MVKTMIENKMHQRDNMNSGRMKMMKRCSTG